jgi:hypothetical protein
VAVEPVELAAALPDYGCKSGRVRAAGPLGEERRRRKDSKATLNSNPSSSPSFYLRLSSMLCANLVCLADAFFAIIGQVN